MKTIHALFTVFFVCVSQASTKESSKEVEGEPDQISAEVLVNRLNLEDDVIRRQAGKELLEMGKEAEADLKQGRNSSDPMIREHYQWLLDSLDAKDPQESYRRKWWRNDDRLNAEVKALNRDEFVRRLGQLQKQRLKGVWQEVRLFLRESLQRDIPEVLPLALRVLSSEDLGHKTRGIAAVVVGWYGEGKHIGELEVLLGNDSIRMGVKDRTGTRWTKTGDLALAAMIHLKGGELDDFGFVTGYKNEGVSFRDTFLLAFRSEASRQAAIAKWKIERANED